MSKIFKPRRGKASTMAGSKKTTVLAAGEFFMEVPDTGVGTGKAKIKMGDGATQYSSLPYALGDTSTDKINLVSNSATTVAAALNSMANGNTLGTQLGAAKQACTLLNNGVTKLNEDLPFKFGIDNDGNYGYYKAGADTVTPFKTGENINVHRQTINGLTGHSNYENKGHISLLLKTMPYSGTFSVGVYGSNDPDELSHGSKVTALGTFEIKAAQIGVTQVIDTGSSYKYIITYPVYKSGWTSGTGAIAEIKVY